MIAELLTSLAGGLLAGATSSWLTSRQRPSDPPEQSSESADDQHLPDAVCQAASIWCSERGRPEAAPLAAGYLLDSVTAIRRRSQERP